MDFFVRESFSNILTLYLFVIPNIFLYKSFSHGYSTLNLLFLYSTSRSIMHTKHTPLKVLFISLIQFSKICLRRHPNHTIRNKSDLFVTKKRSFFFRWLKREMCFGTSIKFLYSDVGPLRSTANTSMFLITIAVTLIHSNHSMGSDKHRERDCYQGIVTIVVTKSSACTQLP